MFDPSKLKGPENGTPNQVLVLGTPHLSGMPDSFRPDTLKPLLDRLESWQPTAIATEDVSGLQCYFLRQYPERYAESVKYYCFDPVAATKATGLDVPAATAEVERLLATWPESPSASDRRKLAAVFLAGGERGSALVQWLRLPASERHAEGILTQELVDYLNTYQARKNETGLIASALAAKLGLERVWSVDDHSADMPTPAEEEEAYNAAISAAWDNPATKQRISASERLNARLGEPEGLMELYRSTNAPDQALLAFKSDFGAAMEDPSPEGFGRKYLGYWETRNLRMVANMREVLMRKPGTRLLAIVGASHKGYYEAYLNQMHDVHLADVMEVLNK